MKHLTSLTNLALDILNNFSIHAKMPASLSGKYHIGESHIRHLEMATNVMRHLCNEFKISKEDTDMLVAATWLHDIGLYVITKKGNWSGDDGWVYYEKTDYSRLASAMQSHGTIGASILSQYKDLPRLKEIQNLVSVHMSHWYPMQPQPKTMYENLICIADYTASRGEGIFKVEERG